MTALLGTTADGAPLELDLDRLTGSHACIVANSGGGKSGAIRRVLETTYGRVQHIVLDLEDEFYSLRERFDYVIAGGDGGDVPLSVAGAGGLALATLTHGFSLIVQLNDLGPSAPEFVGRFLAAMIGAPRHLWRPVLVVIDEAQRFAPQDGSTAASAGVKALTAQGRKRGFTAILATQRIAKIDADVRGDVNNWMLGRVGQSLDRRTMADLLGFRPSGGEARSLQGMPDRTFWGFGPAISREPVQFRVSDVETTPVRPGQAKVPTPPPAAALRKILSGLAKEEPAAEAAPAGAGAPNWPDQRAQVSDLSGQLAATKAEAAAAEDRGYQRGLSAGVSIGITRCRTTIDALRVPDIVEDLVDQIPAASAGETRPIAPAGKSEQVPPRPAPPVKPRPAPASVGEAPSRPMGGASLSGLNAAAEALAGLLLGMPDRTARWADLLVLAGFRPGSGWIRKSHNQLVEEAYVEGSPDKTLATEKLIESDIIPLTTPTPAEVRAVWRAKLRGPGGTMATWSAQNGPATREEIAKGIGMSPTAGWTRKGFKDLLGSNLAYDDGQGRFVAHPLLVGQP